MRITIIIASILLLVAPSAVAQKKPLVVFVAADQEYGSEDTLPLLAKEIEKRYGFRTKVLKSYPDQNRDNNIPGLDYLRNAHLAVFFLRWQKLPPEQVAEIDTYLKTGKPIIAFRTTTHAFNYPKGDPLEKWNAFGQFALGSPPGWGADGHTHYGHNSSTDVQVIAENEKDPILFGVDKKFHARSWLYHVVPKHPPTEAKRLLMGTAVSPDKPAVPNPVAWTWKNSFGARVFTTTLGHPDDFRVEPFQRLVANAVHWTLNLGIPRTWAGPMDIHVPYQGFRKPDPTAESHFASAFMP